MCMFNVYVMIGNFETDRTCITSMALHGSNITIKPIVTNTIKSSKYDHKLKCQTSILFHDLLSKYVIKAAEKAIGQSATLYDAWRFIIVLEQELYTTDVMQTDIKVLMNLPMHIACPELMNEFESILASEWAASVPNQFSSALVPSSATSSTSLIPFASNQNISTVIYGGLAIKNDFSFQAMQRQYTIEQVLQVIVPHPVMFRLH